MTKILVTGGAGFVGSNLVRRLQEEQPDARLLVVDDCRTGTFRNLGGEGKDGWSFQGEMMAASLRGADVYDLVDEFDPGIVFHQAAITDTTVTDEARMIAENVEPFETLAAAAVQRGFKLVWASSAATYGRSARGAVEARRPFRLEDAGQPANAYGFSKWIMENVHRRVLAENPSAHIVGLRYFNVFGPNERHKAHMASMIYKLSRQMLEGKRPRIFHDGEQARDHVYVKDVVSATLAAAGSGARSGIYNVGTGRATTFNRLVEILNEALGTRLDPEYFENPYAFYQDFTCADLTETRSGLGWSPRFTVEEGVADYLQALRPDESP
jgi:ADP-L-glycero-D-manno-heptose 6-epimerase